MVSGLTGTSSQHTHVFRDLAKLTRKNILAHSQGSAKTESETDETGSADETEPAQKDSKEMISKLEERNRDVLAHEGAHMTAGGAYIKGGASYTYQIGPDGKAYAIGGEVSIDMSPVPGNPRATITKMMAIRAAALSPNDPSGQDLSVAAAAAQIEAAARTQLNQVSATNTGTFPLQTAANRYTPSAAAAGTWVNAIA